MVDEDFNAQLIQIAELEFREDFITALCDLYVACQFSAQRAQIRDRVRSGELVEPAKWKNPNEYRRLDLPREKWLRQMLVQLSIEHGSGDYRDELCALAYCYHNLLLLGQDADNIFRLIGKLSDVKFERFICGFVDRTPAFKSLGAFNLFIRKSPDGPVAEPI